MHSPFAPCFVHRPRACAAAVHPVKEQAPLPRLPPSASSSASALALAARAAAAASAAVALAALAAAASFASFFAMDLPAASPCFRHRPRAVALAVQPFAAHAFSLALCLAHFPLTLAFVLQPTREQVVDVLPLLFLLGVADPCFLQSPRATARLLQPSVRHLTALSWSRQVPRFTANAPHPGCEHTFIFLPEGISRYFTPLSFFFISSLRGGGINWGGAVATSVLMVEAKSMLGGGSNGGMAARLGVLKSITVSNSPGMINGIGGGGPTPLRDDIEEEMTLSRERESNFSPWLSSERKRPREPSCSYTTSHSPAGCTCITLAILNSSSVSTSTRSPSVCNANAIAVGRRNKKKGKTVRVCSSRVLEKRSPLVAVAQGVHATASARQRCRNGE